MLKTKFERNNMASFVEHFVITCLIAVLIYSNKKYIRHFFFTREDDAMIGLENAIGNSTSNYKKVAVGVNANVDLIVSALKLFDELDVKPGTAAQNHNTISSLQELDECFQFYFKRCAAAERFVSSRDVFDKIVDASRKIASAQYDVGGNAALMGLKMIYSNSNSTILLGGPIGPKLKAMLDDRIVTPKALLQDSDEYHLILEYGKGETWGEHSSSCANRFIITHDSANGQMTAMKKFFDSLDEFQPDLLVISGLHLLEGQTEDIKQDKLIELRQRLQAISEDVPIHLELASMTSPQFMKDLSQQIFPVVDSIGLNEQELAFLSTSLSGPGGSDELTQWPPEIGLMADAIDWLLHMFGRNERYGSVSSRLTRIHFHCLTYHIIAAFPGSWSNSLAATAAGSRAASRQACNKEHLESIDVELRTPKVFARSVKIWELRRLLVKRDKANPVTMWENNGVDFHFSAVLVCKNPKRTVGLGDCISATGLQYSKFLFK